MDFTKQTVRILEGKNEDSLLALQIPNNLLYGWHLQRNDGCRYMIVDEVHERQQKRKVASIKHGSEQALSFVKTFGLSVEKVVLRSPTKIIELTYDLPESSAGCSSSSSTAADKETGNVDETLFLLERFGVSDECYHEMTQLFPELPRSYVVKNERKDISQSIELKELPSKYKGAYRPVRKFIEAILTDKVSYQP